MDKKTWFTVFQEVEPYVVKITTPQSSGTGFLVAATEDQGVYGIATAAHVIDFAHYWEQPLRIQHAHSGKTIFLNHADRVIDIDYVRDMASILIRGGTLPLPAATLPLISEDKHLKVGVEIGWMGFPAIAPNNLCFFSGTTSCWVESDGYYFVDGVAINGVSGGPAFSVNNENNVHIIGVVSAYIPNRATGQTLPGLCVVRDVLPLYQTVKGFKNLDDAKKQEKTPEAPPPPPPTPLSQDQTRL